MNIFDVAGRLPTSTTLLEASAGTGKTYTIAALTARYLAEAGADVSELLLITFGNHASNELRSRVFARLQKTHDALAAHVAGEPMDETDPVSELLAATDAALHRDRLAVALARFNEATVLTTHAFCDAMLEQLGILGDWDRTEQVGPDPVDVVEQCSVDTYLRLYSSDPQPPFEARTALNIGREACLTGLPLLPSSGPHREFAEEVRALYAKRKGLLGVRTFDDVTQRLRSILEDGQTGPLVRDLLQARYPYVLVDEFQDTDPDQWAIIRAAFVAHDRPTILIGDPKQSIYGFRGADLGSYLAAKQHAEVATLGTNFRSDQSLVEGVTELFGERSLGAADVVVTPVDAHHEDRRRALGTPRVRIRRAPEAGLPETPESAIDNDLVGQVRLLTQTVSPTDIAVLVRTGFRAQQIAQRLTDAGHPAVVTGSQSVWERPAAAAWATLLRAMDNPTQATIRLAALTPLVGSRLADLLAEGSSEPARVSALVRELARRFDGGGVAAVLAALRASAELDARLLRLPGGDRELTDLVHLAELLDASGARSLSTLISLLERDRREEDADSLRISTDQAAVRVMTLHAAKGLEFPVVLLPETVGTAPRPWNPFTIVENGRRHLYVGPRPDRRDEITTDLEAQTLDEELRLLYVGFTRAKHLAIAWQVDLERTYRDGPLTLLLKKLTLPRLVRVEALDPTPVAPRDVEPSAPEQLIPPPRLHPIDRTWRRTSYSGLTAGLHEAFTPVVADEPTDVDVPLPPPTGPELSAPSPMAGLPAGAAFGTLVHEAFELLDWSPGHLTGSARALMAHLGPEHALSAEDSAQLAEALAAACRTPLLPLTPVALTDLPTADRLPELDFDLPLADHGAPATLSQLAHLMARWLPADDPLATYPARLAASEAAAEVLNGFLTGSIDAVLRLPDGSFAVVDYKTNRLSPAAQDPLTLGHYTQPAMAEAMMQAHYPLQAILYCVALHRYLALRVSDYDPDRHLGGVGYLFVRGLAGPDTPVVDGASCGVFGWFPPSGLVLAASALLGGTDA